MLTKEQIQNFRDKPLEKFQQGDVLIRLVDFTLPAEKVVVGDNVVVASSNPHTVSGGNLFKVDEALFCTVEKKATFSHREHEPIVVKPGTYFIEPKVEVDFLSDMVRPVQD